MSSDRHATKENSEKTKNGATQGPSEAHSAHKGMGLAFFLFGAAYVVGTVLQHLFVMMNTVLSAPQRSISVDLGLILFTVVLVAGFAPKWHRFLSSNRFAVPALV